MRSFRQDTSPVEAFADDYAFVISGLLVGRGLADAVHSVHSNVAWLPHGSGLG